VPIGAFDPLRGARPFHRPPHTGYATVSYNGEQYSVGFTAAVATRSDDSTFLAGRDFAGGNSLLLPNRNLDFGYTKLDLGGSYQFLSWLGAYAQLDNLTSNKKIAPIGYPSLPFTFRVGLRLAIGHSGNK
jgi:vitamin B12 transporter